MSRKWTHRFVGRRTVNRRAASKVRRSLLLEGLENRQLLAMDTTLVAELPAELPSNAAAHSLVPEGEGSSHAGSMANMAHSGHPMAHPAAMALISADQATNTVAASGDWSDPNTWENSTLPEAGARIVIPEGMTLTVDSVIPTEFKTIGVHGTLRFATDVNTELRVDTIVSAPDGRFEMGTAANPIDANATAKVVFADDGTIDTNWDPEQLSRGAILQGPTEIHGSETTHRVTLASHPAAGTTSIELSSAPTGWKVGDEIIITGTQGSTSDEVRTIQSIDGTTVTLNQALELDHIPPRSDLNVYVANTTRNVGFSSENAATANRGHIMFMHTNNVRVANAEFTDLGRTDKTRPLDDVFFNFDDDAIGNETSAGTVFTTTTGPRTNIRGRYAVHFHRGGIDPNGAPAVINGSVVNGSPGWGFVNHSSNVDMVDNVAYGVHGASFYTEAGDEIGSMVGNIAIRSVSPTFTLDDGGAIDPDLRADVQDFGVDGEGFWLSGHLVSMRNNVSAGASAHGIIIWSDGLVEADTARGRTTVRVSDIENGHLITGRDTIPSWWAPLAEIKDNESFGAVVGFRSRYVHSAGYLGEIGSEFHTPPDQAYIDTLHPTIDGLTVWDSRDGALMNYNERMSLKNARLIGMGAPYEQNGGTADTGVGLDMYNEVTRGPGVIENVSIEGYNMGFLAPRNDSWQINNLHLQNTTDMLITESRQAARVLDMNNVTFGSLDGTAVAGNEGQRRNIVMRADFDADAHQPFFFLLSDQITFDGQQLYFNAQEPNFVPLKRQIEHEGVRIPEALIGATNQTLMTNHGTSFGGAITPEDATEVSWLTGGKVGSVSPPPATYPPLYHMASEGAGAVLIDPGTLTNFDGPLPGPGGDGGDVDPGEDDENTGNPPDEDEDKGEETGECEDESEDGEETDTDGEDTDEGDNDAGDDEESDEGEDESGDGDSDEEGDDGEETEDGEDTDEGDTDAGDDEESDEAEDETGDGDGDEEGDDEEGTEDGENTDEGDNDAGDDEEIDEGEDSEGDDDTGDDEGENDEDPDEGDIFPVSASLVGSSESEKLQGFESDDVVTGHGGADLFPLTAGNDIITDFHPTEDRIDVGDFARTTDGFAVLTSLEAIAANSTQTTVDGQTALVIDVDGELGDSTTTLIGITINDLNESNVFFGLDGESIPPLDFTHIPETTVTLNDGTIARFAGHDLSVHPLPFELVSGSPESIDILNGVGSGDTDGDSGISGELGGLHNLQLPTDVNADSLTSAIDALIIINHLNLSQAGREVLSLAVAWFVDVNNDGHITAIDALQVINTLNGVDDSPEGELSTGPNGVSFVKVTPWPHTVVESAQPKTAQQRNMEYHVTPPPLRAAQELATSSSARRSGEPHALSEEGIDVVLRGDDWNELEGLLDILGDDARNDRH